VKAIDSVINQSYPYWKLIIIDDGSNDNTYEEINKFLGDDRISYHFQENSGVSSARNAGIELADTEYVVFLDSDDYFLPGLFEKLFEVDLDEYDLICWWAIKKTSNDEYLWKPRRLEAIYNYQTATFLAGSICYKRDLLVELGGFDTNLEFGENYELGIRICQNQQRIKLIDKEYLVINSKSRTEESIPQRIHSCIYQYKKHRKLFKEDQISETQILYMIAYLLEKSLKKTSSLRFYKSSWRSKKTNMKAFIKILLLKFQGV